MYYLDYKVEEMDLVNNFLPPIWIHWEIEKLYVV